MISIEKAEDRKYIDIIVNFQKQMAFETEELKLDDVVLRAGVSEVFDNPSRGKYLVALREGKVVGMLFYLSEWSDWRNAEVLWIHSVFVILEYRGQGFYKAMYEHMKQMVTSSEKYAGLRLYVDKSNLNAQKVYEKLGMSKEHYELYEWLK